MRNLAAELGQTLLVGSGAIGTLLRNRKQGHPDELVEILNLHDPEIVRGVHESYRDAGSRILVTNTFSANAISLASAGLVNLCGEINETGVRLARQVAGADCSVWASVGPLSLGLNLDDYSDDELLNVYREQCRMLVKADTIVLETFTDPREARAAVTAAAETALPFVFQVGNVGGGRDKLNRIATLADMAVSAGATAVGSNCQHPNEIVRVTQFLAGRAGIPLTASPNAGHPEVSRGLVRYDFSPAMMLETAEKLAAAGCAVIGGCCGTTPEHIRAISHLNGRKIAPGRSAVQISAEAGTGRRESASAENPVRSLIASGRTVISVEIRADRKRRMDEILSGAREIASAGADMFDVPDNPGATVGRDAMVTAAKLQDTLGIPAVPHKTVVHANMLQIHSTLIGCWDIGLRGIMVVTGDPPSMGHLSGMAKLVGDMKSSVEMLRLIRSMRQGHMVNEEEIADSPDFCAGCAVGQPTPQQINWLRKKKEAGAEFVLSQPVFSIDDFRRLRDEIIPLGLRLFTGIMPLTSRKSAEFLAGGRIPGIRVPASLVERLGACASAEDQRKHGLEYAAEIALTIVKESRSLYLIMPFGKNCYSDTAGIVRAVRTS